MRVISMGSFRSYPCVDLSDLQDLTWASDEESEAEPSPEGANPQQQKLMLNVVYGRVCLAKVVVWWFSQVGRCCLLTLHALYQLSSSMWIPKAQE